MISTAILVGALVVGDSVRGSLEQMALMRLGRTELALSSGDRFFRGQLAHEISTALDADVAPVLKLNGIAVRENSRLRVNRVQVLGVDSWFWNIGQVPDPFSSIKADEAVINQRLAYRLGMRKGDEFLLRIEKVNLIPGDVPLSSRDNSSAALRLYVKAVAADAQFGRFCLRANQVPPFTVFLPLSYLTEKIDLKGKANMMLAAGKNGKSLTPREADAALAAHWQMSDIGLQLRELLGNRGVELISDHVFIDPPVEAAALQAGPLAKGILSYFVNQIRVSTRSTPYSFIAAPGMPLVPDDMQDDEIIINEWVSEDIGAALGDTVQVTYYVPGVGLRLEEKTSHFKVRAIVPIKGPAADRELMPMFPGLSDVKNCREWDPGIPIDLDKIRDKDEAYWNTFRGTPKAFITLSAARHMWRNRFGSLTSVRYPGTEEIEQTVAANIMKRLKPEKLGLYFRPVRKEGIRAGSEAVDFGQLFIGLSFFIIAAALLLTGLLFVLGIEQRSKETGILLALGFKPRQVKQYLLAEGAAIAFIGSLLGCLCGIFYNQVVLFFLGTLWRGAVGTSALYLHLEPITLFIGTILGFGMAFLAMALAVRKQTRRPILELQGSISHTYIVHKKKKPGISLFFASACFIGVLVILGMVSPGKGREAANAFWGAGVLMLTGSLVFCHTFLIRLEQPGNGMSIDIPGLGRRNSARKQGRSLATIALLSCGIFIVIATGANRHGSLKNAGQRDSGTGGFAFYGETTLPVRNDLNLKKNQRFIGLGKNDQGIRFVQMRVREGDDASCLNLNRIKNPRILGVRPEQLSVRGAFSFVKWAKGIETEKSWMILDKELENGVIPAVADQSVIVWGLGKSIGDILTYTDERGRELKLKLIGGLANSIFQGSVIISERAFISHFPSISGSRVLLIDVPVGSRSDIKETLTRAMQDYGLELTSAVERLAEFNMVQDTYLSIFLALGGLGLILGTVGMGIVILRNVMERRSELALLRAVGFSRRALNRMVLSEHFLLLALGVVCGTVSAIVAVLPALMSPGAGIPYMFLFVTLAAVVVSGCVWVVLATRVAAKGDLVPALRSE
jgi:putative ABC transport system permease protein